MESSKYLIIDHGRIQGGGQKGQSPHPPDYQKGYKKENNGGKGIKMRRVSNNLISEYTPDSEKN